MFDERYGDAVDIPTSDEEDAVDAARPQSFSPAPDKGKGKSKQKEVTEPPVCSRVSRAMHVAGYC